MVSFSAVPKLTSQAEINSQLEAIVELLKAHGCEILRVGKFAVSASSSWDVFSNLENNLQETPIATLEVAIPPEYFTLA